MAICSIQFQFTDQSLKLNDKFIQLENIDTLKRFTLAKFTEVRHEFQNMQNLIDSMNTKKTIIGTRCYQYNQCFPTITIHIYDLHTFKIINFENINIKEGVPTELIQINLADTKFLPEHLKYNQYIFMLDKKTGKITIFNSETNKYDIGINNITMFVY